MSRRVCVYVPTLTVADAVSDQARHHARLLRSWGHEVELVADGWHPACAGEVLAVGTALDRWPDAAWVVHYSIWAEGIGRIAEAGGHPRAFVFHNVTPPGLVGSGPIAERCQEALDALPGLAGRWDVVIADSAFNARDLEDAGFPAAEVVPPLLPEGPSAAADTPRGTGVLYVGRVAPSKGLDDLVKAFALLRLLHRPDATLDIVGSSAGWERYTNGLLDLVEATGAEGVTLRGVVTDAERDELYARAGVVCLLSRHEGFCVPLVEAMRAGAPVVARDAGAMGETLGDGGVLLPDGDPRLAAEALAAVLDDAGLREQLRAGAVAATARFTPEAVEAALRRTLGAALSGG